MYKNIYIYVWQASKKFSASYFSSSRTSYLVTGQVNIFMNLAEDK